MAKFVISKLTKWNFLLIVIILISGFLRLYRIDELHTFHNDEGRDALIAAEMIRTGKPTLLGPQTSVGNMYLGPLYYYLMVPALFLSGGNPVGPAIMVALSGVLTTYLIYLVSQKWFGKISGIIASLVFATSPLFVHYTASSWNPNLVPLISILIIMALEAKKYFWLGLLFGILFQLHYVAMAFAVVVVIWSLYSSKNPRIIIVMLLGFVFATAPFWLFEVRHDFLNIQALFTYLEGTGVKNGATAPYISRVFNNTLSVISNIVLSRTLTHNNTNVLMFALSILSALLTLPWFIKKESINQSANLWYILVATIFLSSLLKENLYPHYLGYLFPIVSIIIGSIACTRYRLVRYFGFTYILIWLFYSIPFTTKALVGEGSKQKLKGQEVAGYILRDSQGRPYNVVSALDNSRETTYVYFLRQLENPPSAKPEQILYIICEDRPCIDKDASTPLIFSRGSAHPYLDFTLTHPYTPTSTIPKTLISSTHIVYGVWVARVIVGDNQ